MQNAMIASQLLPPEIWVQICSYLRPDEKGRLAQASRELNIYTDQKMIHDNIRNGNCLLRKISDFRPDENRNYYGYAVVENDGCITIQKGQKIFQALPLRSCKMIAVDTDQGIIVQGKEGLICLDFTKQGSPFSYWLKFGIVRKLYSLAVRIFDSLRKSAKQFNLMVSIIYSRPRNYKHAILITVFSLAFVILAAAIFSVFFLYHLKTGHL
jgi:hypothetical protein